MPFEPDQGQFVPDEPQRKGLRNYQIGAGEAALSFGTGILGTAAGGFAGLGRALAPGDESIQDRLTRGRKVLENVQDAMTYQPRTPVGQGFTSAASAPFELLAKGAEKAGEKVTALSRKSGLAGSDTDAAFLGALTDAGIQLAPGMIGRVIPKESPAAVAARAKTESLNAPVDKGIAAAREAGLKVTPTQAGSGVLARGAESIVGSERLQKAASRQNVPTINDLIRKDVGLAEDEPISRAALASVRKEAGKSYEAIKQSGSIDADASYQADIYAITKSVDQASKDFSHRSENPFKKTMDGLNVSSMDAASAIEEVKLLREDADKAFTGGDKRMGKAYKDAAQALDNLIDRHLKKFGLLSDAVAVKNYQDARILIAKTYAAEKALNDTTGNINAGVYAAALKRGTKLTGEAKQVANFAAQFPKAAQPAERLGPTGPTVFDAAPLVFGDIPMSLKGLLFGARPIGRSAMLTGPVQNAITAPRSYGKPGLRRLQDLLDEAGMTAATAGAANNNREGR